jgi:hypothetical protein
MLDQLGGWALECVWIKVSVIAYTKTLTISGLSIEIGASMKGYIYKITHRDHISGENEFPGRCYIGQTRKSINERWTEHRNACLKYEGSKSLRKSGTHAKLYETMALERIPNFKIEQLAEYESQDQNELIDILYKAEDKYIKKYDSIKKGWNTKQAARSAVRNPEEESLYQKARESNVAYNSLRYRINTLDESVEDAINYLKNKKNDMTTIYRYKRQSFATIREIAESTIHNPNRLNKATIERRIRKLRKKNQINEDIDKEKNELRLILIEEIFAPVITREISVKTPDGDTVTGNKKDVHVKLLKRYPDLVPENYQTFISRTNKTNWSLEQASGLEYPPDLFPIKPLIETKGYTWANGQKPNFLTQDGKPVILHETKEIFPNQAQFAAAYGLPTDMVSDYLNVKKMTPEGFLKHKGLTLSF